MESTNRTEQQNSKVEVHGKVVARLVPPVLERNQRGGSRGWSWSQRLRPSI